MVECGLKMLESEGLNKYANYSQFWLNFCFLKVQILEKDMKFADALDELNYLQDIVKENIPIFFRIHL